MTRIDTFSTPPQGDLEGTARVVAVDDRRVWLEPEQGGSCGACASSAACGAKGIGTLASRLEGRRFSVARDAFNGVGEPSVGERLVITFGEQSVAGIAMVAYGLPLATALGAAVYVQALAGQDGYTLLAALAGLGFGFGLTKLLAARLSARGFLQPRILRRLQTTPIFPVGH